MTTTAAPKTPQVLPDHVKRAARLMFVQGQTVEVRGIDVQRNGRYRPVVEAGYFNSGEASLKAIVDLAPHARGLYWTMNQLNPDLLARRANRLAPAERDSLTSDKDIELRRFLLVDVDPKRLANISSTDAEHDDAIALTREIQDWLTSEGWPEPMLVDSGNGAQLLYRIDELADDGGLIERCLKALAVHFNTHKVEVDTGVFNAARLAKIPGTPVRKGDNTDDRPHRLSRILEAPDRLDSVPHKLLEALAALVPEGPKQGYRRGKKGTEPALDVPRFLADAGVGLRHDGPYADGTLYRLESCPRCDSIAGNPYLIQFGSDALKAGCFESDCALTWTWLREQFPDAYSAQKETRSERPSTGPADEFEPLPLVFMSDVPRREVNWLWLKWIPFGKVTLLAGDVDLGKTTLLMDLAARMSVAGKLPDGRTAPRGNTLILTAEDSLEDTIGPRLDAHGADSTRVVAVHLDELFGKGRSISLSRDMPALNEAVERVGARLLIIDTLDDFTARVDSYKSPEVRQMLHPLGALARETGCAVVCVMHINKNSAETNPRNRVMGSKGYIAYSRSALLVAEDRADRDRRYLVRIKGNLSARPEPLAFHFEGNRLTWDGTADVDPEELLAPVTESRASVADAVGFLEDLLADGPQPVAEIRSEAKAANISWRTVERAKAILGISIKNGCVVKEPGKGWTWRLPDSAGGKTANVSTGVGGLENASAGASWDTNSRDTDPVPVGGLEEGEL